MNTNILTKCIEELKNVQPDLSYLRGMLETLVEIQTPEVRNIVLTKDILKPGAVSTTEVDESAILDAKARAALETIKALGGEQTE